VGPKWEKSPPKKGGSIPSERGVENKEALNNEGRAPSQKTLRNAVAVVVTKLLGLGMEKREV